MRLTLHASKVVLFLTFIFLLCFSFDSRAQGPWQTNGSTIYYNGGNVAVGITNTTAPFQVYGGNAILWGLQLGFGTGLAVITTDAATKELSFQLGGTEYARLATGGSFVIGRNNLINAGDKFEVTGQANIMGLTLGYGTGLGVITTDAAVKELSFQLGGTEKARLSSNGNFLIGKSTQTNTNYKLDVNGLARFNQVTVNTNGADFVFDPAYKLPSLKATEEYIRLHHHLKDVAPACEMQQKGLDLGANQTVLLQKIEELTLYTIDQDKKMAAQQIEIDQLKKMVEKLAAKK